MLGVVVNIYLQECCSETDKMDKTDRMDLNGFLFSKQCIE